VGSHVSRSKCKDSQGYGVDRVANLENYPVLANPERGQISIRPVKIYFLDEHGADDQKLKSIDIGRLLADRAAVLSKTGHHAVSHMKAICGLVGEHGGGN